MSTTAYFRGKAFLHWSKHVKFRPSWLFQKGCLSLRSCQTVTLPHVGTLNSAYCAFSTFQSAFIWAIALVVLWNSFLGWPWANLALLAQRQNNTDVYKGLLPWEGFPGQTWSLCHGNQHHGIDPNMSNSGRLSLHSWQTAMLAHVGTEWHILAHVGIQLSPPFIHQDNSFSGSIKFFHFIIALGLALEESWCATTEKHWCPQRHGKSFP